MPRHPKSSSLSLPQPHLPIPSPSQPHAGPSSTSQPRSSSKRRRSKPWSAPPAGSSSSSSSTTAAGSGAGGGGGGPSMSTSPRSASSTLAGAGGGGDEEGASGSAGGSGSKKRKRKGTTMSTMGTGVNAVGGGGAAGGVGGREGEEVRSRFFDAATAPAEVPPSSSKGKARASPRRDINTDEPSSLSIKNSMKKLPTASTSTSTSTSNPILSPGYIPISALSLTHASTTTTSNVAAPAPVAHNELRERARRMKEMEDLARERAGKEVEMKELKLGEERLRRELAFKDSELEAQKDTLGRVKDSLTCNICMELLWQPYLLSPCGHTACFTCLKAWFLSPQPDDQPLLPPRQRPKSCPNCRGAVVTPPTPIYIIKDLVQNVAGRLSLLEGGAARPDPEGAEPWRGIFEEGEIRRRGMRDEEDGVERCVDCGYEINDGSCVNCGAVYLENDDSDGSLEADDLVGFLYGDGQDHAEDDGPGFEFGDESDEGESEEGSVLTDGFLVDDEEVLILSGSDSEEEEEEGEGDELDEATARAILNAKGATDAMIDRFHLKLSGLHIRALIPSTLYPEDPHRLTIKNDIYIAPNDPYGDRFLLTYLRGSRSGRKWLREEKAARAATGPVAGGRGRRRNVRGRGEREFSLGSFADEEGSEGEGRLIDLDDDEEEEESEDDRPLRERQRHRQEQQQRRARSNGVPPSVGLGGSRRTIELSDSDEEEEEEEVVARLGRRGGGAKMKKRRVDSSDEDEEEVEDVEMYVGGTGGGGGRRNAVASSSRRRILSSPSSSPQPIPSSSRLRSSRRSNTLPSNSPAPPNNNNLNQESSEENNSSSSSNNSDASSGHSVKTKSRLAHLRRIYGKHASDDEEEENESDPDGLNVLGDGGRNDEGPDGEGYDEEDEGAWGDEGGGGEEGDGGEIWY